MSLCVLYVHHSGVFGGASRSLLEMIRAFPSETVQPYLVTQSGKVPSVFREYQVEVIDTVGLSQFDHTRFGYYRAIRWLILLREIAYVPFTIMALLKARVCWPDIELVHVNEVTNALAIVLAKRLFACPLVVHVRSVQQSEKGWLRRKFVLWLLHQADAVIAIDETVRNSLPDTLPVHVVHNGFNLRQPESDSHGYQPESFLQRPMKVLFVGSLSVMKGILELVHAAKMCADAGLNVKFIMVGDTPRDDRGIKARLLNALGFSYDVKGYCRDYIAEHQLEEMIEFSGFTLDIESVYKSADVLCFPSHLNAVGRPVIEAALLKRPSIVAIRDAIADTVVHEKTGLCIAEKDDAALFDAVKYFFNNPEKISQMGDAAYQLACKNFDIDKNARFIAAVYQGLRGRRNQT